MISDCVTTLAFFRELRTRMMTLKTFVERIIQNKANNYLYYRPDREGLVVVWKYNGKLILTWEECRPGDQFNEHLYTRDERYVFQEINELLDFLTAKGLGPKDFEP